MHTAAAKGKAREDVPWQLGWWELYPLIDGPRRPLAWSRSSVIYTAHASQPLVVARHFPSSRQFFLSLPPHVTEPYEPPTVITVSPADDWLFAFMPGREGAGAGCLWRKGNELDSWTATECWTFAKGAGVVCAEWMFAERPWVVGETGLPYRLPSKGPSTILNSPTLLLVTETHFLHVCVVPPTFPSMKVARLPLLQCSVASQGHIIPPKPPAAKEGEASTAPEPVRELNILNPEDIPGAVDSGRKMCVHAAIGFNYNESDFWVAMRSKYVPAYKPPHVAQAPRFDGMDIDPPMETDPPAAASSASVFATDLEQAGEDATINISMVHFDFNGFSINIQGRPLPPIFRPGSTLSGLRFFTVPPDITPPSPSITRDPRRAVKEGGMSEKGALYLAASFLDFDDYSTLPKSEASVYSIVVMPTSPGRSLERQWAIRLERTRTFEHGVLAFLAPGPSKGTVLAGVLDTAGTAPRRSGRVKQVPIGNISVLKLHDLSPDDRWDSSPIVSSAEGRDIPVGIALSPNETLLCTISPSASAIGHRNSIHSLPRRHPIPSQTPSARSEMSRLLAQAIYTRKSPSDVIHALAEHSTSLETVVNTLYSAAAVLESNTVGLGEMWAEEILGVATEVYLARSKTSVVETEKDALMEHWQTAHDICSVCAFNTAFEDCRDGEKTYELDVIWELIGQTSWLMSLLERIMKQCIFVAEGNPSPKLYQLNANDVDPLSHADASILLHLIHPFALKNLLAAVTHVKRFYDQIHQASPKTELAQLAKDALSDVIDSSGIILNALGHLLEDFEKIVTQNPVDELRRTLVSCSITPALWPVTRQVIDKMLASAVIYRPRLFVKPADLSSSLMKMTLAERPWETETDIVSKGMLQGRPGGMKVVCVRCGGNKEVVHDGRKIYRGESLWMAWETLYSTRCVCGGAWVRAAI
ncbi:hypothetical protein BDW22DRAFT_1390553 [Trametopsis cervina]|nr:hypothetical protein BDW22DRAFT_1390553 [Trametopsis cervina]